FLPLPFAAFFTHLALPRTVFFWKSFLHFSGFGLVAMGKVAGGVTIGTAACPPPGVGDGPGPGPGSSSPSPPSPPHWAAPVRLTAAQRLLAPWFQATRASPLQPIATEGL